MNTIELLKLLNKHGIPLDKLYQSKVNNYGNKFYGNAIGNSYMCTKGDKISTKGKFSEHYLKTGFVTDIGIKNSEDSKINIELVTVFHNGEFIELKVLDDVHEYRITNIMKRVFLDLQDTYRVIYISHVSNGGSSITTTTFTMRIRGVGNDN